MLLKVYNRALIKDREKTHLTATAAAAATSLTVAGTELNSTGTASNTWVNDSYVIVGEIGTETAEVMQVNGNVTSSTAITIDREGQAGGLRNTHPVGEPVYRIDFNQVEFYNGTTDSTASLTTLATIPIQPDDTFTRYEDTSTTTGYGFARFKNGGTGAFSSYSDGVNYTISGVASSRDPRTLWAIKNKIRDLIDEKDETKITDDQITDAVNDKQRDIGHKRLWSFYESQKSQNSVEDQFAYDIPTTLQKVYAAKFRTRPLIPINKRKWDELHWDSHSTASEPSHFCVWNNQMLIWPAVADSAENTTLDGNITAAATTIKFADVDVFSRGDYYRFKIDSEIIYATTLDTTNNELENCLRGQEGTTAATHATGATVTELDLVLSGHEEPTDLIDTQDRTKIPEPEALVYGTAADLAIQLGKETLHDRLKIKYDAAIKSLAEKYAAKQTAHFGHVKDTSEMYGESTAGIYDPNNFPTNIG